MSMAEQTIIKADSYAHERNKELLEKEERELEALIKGQQVDEEQEEPDSESVEDTSVQDEGDTQQEAPKEEAKAPKEELSAEERTFKQRYADVQRHLAKKEKEFKERLETLEGQLSKAAKNELVLPKSDKDIEAWATKYPDVAGIVEAIADKKALERSSDIDNRLKEIEELRVTARREKAEAQLMSMHPDFMEIRESDEFHEWAAKQPKVVQDALYENSEDAKSVGVAIDLYKAQNNITTAKPSNKAAAASVKSKSRTTVSADDSKGVWKESTVAKMSDKEFEKHHEEIHEAQKSGKFIYDLSK